MGGTDNSQQEHEENGGDDGCQFRSTNPPEHGGREITREGKVFRLVDPTQERHNASDARRRQDGMAKDPGKVAADRSPTTNPYEPHSGSEKPRRVRLGKEGGSAGNLVSPVIHDHFPTARDAKNASPLDISTHRRFRHHRGSQLHTRRHRRRHYHDGTRRSIGQRNHHHRRRQRDRLLTSRDEGVHAETIYENGSNNNRYRYNSNNDNETEYDAYSYTIILTDGKCQITWRGGTPTWP